MNKKSPIGQRFHQQAPISALAIVMGLASPTSFAAPPVIEEMIVTAQKRAESLNTIGMSITASSGEDLATRGVKNVGDLEKMVPGFTHQPSPYSTPVYTIRGVGLYDNGLASAPAVTTYIDEVPVPFPAMTTGLTLDVERVEVLKGPQGTLFGQNSTGGAINYIAAKPTHEFAAGTSISYERFGLMDVDGYISGPLSDTVRARLAVRGVSGGDWQYSTTRPEDERGETRQFIGRLLVDWDVTDNLSLNFNLNGFQDRSDTQAQQFEENILNVTAAGDPNNPYAITDPARFDALTNPSSPAYDATFLGRQALVFGRLQGAGGSTMQEMTDIALGGPVAGNNPRAADWSPHWPRKLDKKYHQFALRAEYEINDNLTLTSITAYQELDSSVYQDLDAVSVSAMDYHQFGQVESFSQELRLAGDAGALNWMVGINYDRVEQDETSQPTFLALSLNEPAPGVLFSTVANNLKQDVDTKAIFANVEYYITDSLRLQAGARYTDVKRRAEICSFDKSTDQAASGFFGVNPGECYQLTSNFTPVVSPDVQHLNEDNTSWKVGATYELDNTGILYANASRGFKAGIFSTNVASFANQSDPAVQEQVDAYEIGIKTPLLNRQLQLNAAYFYYDYQDKQIRAKLLDPTFGLLEKLINVPESEVQGLEIELIAQPIEGLRLSLAGTYMESEVTSDEGSFFNQQGYYGTFKGSDLPYTPELTAVFDGQ